MFLPGERYSPLVEVPVDDPVEVSAELPVELVGGTKERIWSEFMP